MLSEQVETVRLNARIHNQREQISHLQFVLGERRRMIDELCELLATHPPYAADTTFAEIWKWIARKDAALSLARGESIGGEL